MRVLNNTQAQALTEFATFASVFLFMIGVLVSYGMSYNTQQEFNMETYRSSYRMAGSPDYSYYARDANLMQVQDRLTVVAAPYPSAARTQYISSASAAWNQGLLSEPVIGHDTNLQVMDYRINDQSFNFTIADFGEYYVSADAQRYLRIKVTSLHPDYDGTYWTYKFIDAYNPGPSGAVIEGITEESDGMKLTRIDLKYDIDNDGELEVITDAAFYTEEEKNSYVSTGRPNYKEMIIMIVDAPYDPDTDEPIANRLGYYGVLDPFAGQIDLTKDINYPQGITPEFSRVFNEDELSMVRQETHEGITTDSKSNIQELVHRRIRLNNQYRDGQPHPDVYAVNEPHIDSVGNTYYEDEYYLDVDYNDERYYNWTWQVPWE